ncbi:23S rRNA (uracil(1939)-C(5))-methyltransferase RlmD [Patescibacteria group bacterium]
MRTLILTKKMQYKKGEIIEVEIKKIAFGGAGIGHYDNRVVFVADTVPGDIVKASLTRIKPKFFEARFKEFIQESEMRIEPRCPHFEECGGCTLQYLTYEDQLIIKEAQVKEALEHIGGFKNPHVKKIIGNKTPWFYRNKMEFSFSEGKLGLHPKGYRYEVFELKECYLQTEKTAEIVQKVQKFAKEHNLEPFHYKKGKGLVRNLVIRFGKNTKERMVNLVISNEEFNFKNEFKELLKDFATSIYVTRIIQNKGRRTETVEELIYGKSVLLEKMCGLKFEILPQAFFQPNTLQAETLYRTVAELGEISDKDIVFDLFCGTGTIGLTLAGKAKQVYGADNNESAIRNAIENASLNDVTNIKFHTGDAYKAVKEWNIKPDVTVVDPPRSGLSKKLCKKLAKLKTPKIIYVSCNPTTQARDLQILKKHGYKLISVQPIDMAPQTYHIETVAKLIYNRGIRFLLNLIKKS